jgi:hypothetical protein
MANMRLREKPKVGPDSYQGVMSAKRPSRKRDLRKIEEWQSQEPSRGSQT